MGAVYAGETVRGFALRLSAPGAAAPIKDICADALRAVCARLGLYRMIH